MKTIAGAAIAKTDTTILIATWNSTEETYVWNEETKQHDSSGVFQSEGLCANIVNGRAKYLAEKEFELVYTNDFIKNSREAGSGEQRIGTSI